MRPSKLEARPSSFPIFRAIAVTNDHVFIGGSFRYVGPYTGGGVPIDVNTMQPVAKYPKVNGSVHAVEPDGNGGWFIGGQFTVVGGDGTGGGVPRKNLAAIDLSVGVTGWNPTAAQIGEVRSLAFHGASVFAVGTFIGPNPSRYEGTRTNADHMVRLDLTTGEPLGLVLCPSVSKLVLSGQVHVSFHFFFLRVRRVLPVPSQSLIPAQPPSAL